MQNLSIKEVLLPSNKPLITFNVSPELQQAIQDAHVKSGMRQSAWIRFVLTTWLEDIGYVIEDPMDQHGGKRKPITESEE